MFDYGCDEQDISRPISNIKRWPKDGERTALVDADSIAYIVGYTSDIQQYLKFKRDKQHEGSSSDRVMNVWMDKIDHANFILNKWVTDAGCDSAILYLTDGANNFRLKIAVTTPYKGQRVEEKPPFFYEIREWLLKFHGAVMSDYCEADDEISIEAWRRHLAFDSELWTPGHKKFSNFVVVSGDKDLGIIPGWKCPPDGVLEWVDPLGYLSPVWRDKDVVAYEYWPLFKGKTKPLDHCSTVIKYQGKIQIRDRGQVECPKDKWELDYIWFCDGVEQDKYIRGANKGVGKFKRMKVGTKKSEYIHKLKGAGLMFFYSQLLTGDAVDNYKGLPGVGDVKAYEVLCNAKSEQEMIHIVKQLYCNEYGEAWLEHLNEMGSLAWMQTYRGEIWSLPNSKGQSYPA